MPAPTALRCQVMESSEAGDSCASAAPQQAALLEAVLSRDLSHPNIVQTFDYATRTQKVRGMGPHTRLAGWVVAVVLGPLVGG